MTAAFIKRLQKFFLHIQRNPSKFHKEKEKDTFSKVYESLETHFGVSFSSDSIPSVVSDSEDDSEGKSVSYVRVYSKDIKSTTTSGVDTKDDESTKSTSTEKFKSAALFYRTISQVSRNEIECLMHKSSSENDALQSTQ